MQNQTQAVTVEVQESPTLSSQSKDELSLADFAGGSDPVGQSGDEARKSAAGFWETAPLEGGSHLWAFGAGFLSGKVKTRKEKEKFMPYLENYMNTVTPILQLIEFDRVAGIGGLENVEMDDSTRFKVGIGALVLSSFFVSSESQGPSLSDLLGAFLGAGSDPVQLAKNLEKVHEKGTGETGEEVNE